MRTLYNLVFFLYNWVTWQLYACYKTKKVSCLSKIPLYVSSKAHDSSSKFPRTPLANRDPLYSKESPASGQRRGGNPLLTSMEVYFPYT